MQKKMSKRKLSSNMIFLLVCYKNLRGYAQSFFDDTYNLFNYYIGLYYILCLILIIVSSYYSSKHKFQICLTYWSQGIKCHFLLDEYWDCQRKLSFWNYLILTNRWCTFALGFKLLFLYFSYYSWRFFKNGNNPKAISSVKNIVNKNLYVFYD